jgi:hypothetical protein
MFNKGDKLNVKSSVTVKDLCGIGFDKSGAQKILTGGMRFVADGHGYSRKNKEKYTIAVINYGVGCWIWKDWIRPKQEQLTFVFTE